MRARIVLRVAGGQHRRVQLQPAAVDAVQPLLAVLLGEQRAAVEGIHAAARRPHRATRTMKWPGSPTPSTRQAGAPPDLHVDGGERDGDAGAAVEHVVQEAVARVVVVLAVAAEALLVEEEPRSARATAATAPARAVEPRRARRAPCRRAAAGRRATSSSGYSSQAISSAASARSIAPPASATRPANCRSGSGSHDAIRSWIGAIIAPAGAGRRAEVSGTRTLLLRGPTAAVDQRRPRRGPPPRASTSSTRAAVAGLRGTKSWQQSWSGSVLTSKVPIRRACCVISSLSMPDQRAQDRPARGLVDDGHVVEGLRGHLAQALAGDQRLGAACARPGPPRCAP